MIVKSQGIILNSLKYGETSLICKIFTAEFGVCSFMVNGVFGQKKGKWSAGMFQPATILELVFYKSETSLNRLKEAKLKHFYQYVQRDFVRNSMAIYFCDLLKNILIENNKDDEVYTLFHDALLILDEEIIDQKYHHLNFTIQLAMLLGISAGNEYYNGACFDIKESIFIPIKPQHQFYLDKIESKDFNAFLSYKNSFEVKSNRKILLKKILLYIQFHIEHFKMPKSLEVLEMISRN